jgi:nitrate reductase assembly molybdenum cofactor insertion protein NarJ
VDYAAFAELLDYPGAGVPRAPEVVSSSAVRPLIEEFARRAAALGPERLEEVYAQTFDLQPDRTLNLSHHLFADEWKRSAMLIELKALFQRHALDHGSELPDHLCWLLRLMALAPGDDELRELRAHLLVPALRALSERVREEANPYRPLLEALVLVAGEEGASA